MKILFMGHHEWAYLTLEALINSKHKIVGVVAEPEEFDQKYKWGEKYRDLKELAKEHNIPVFQPKTPNTPEFIQTMEKLNPELIVSVSYHAIIKKEILDKWPVINAHNALLPKYRGRAPINWAIINGEKETGVTIHYLVEELDKGDIILQESVPIKYKETAGEVWKRCLPLYPKLVLKAVDMIGEGIVQRIKQDESKATYFSKRTPKDGIIDWNKTTLQLYNWVRALTHPYPGAFTYYNGKKLIIWKVKEWEKDYKGELGQILENIENEGMVVKCKDGSIIIERIQDEDTNEMDAWEYFKKFSLKVNSFMKNG